MNSLVFYTYDDLTARPFGLLDLGQVAPRSSDDINMQVRNVSDTYQAEDVIVEVQAGAAASQLFLSLDGDSFSHSVVIGDIAPGAGSVVFVLRRVTPSNAASGITFANLTATPAGWMSVVDHSSSTNVALDAEVVIPAFDDPTQPPIPEGP